MKSPKIARIIIMLFVVFASVQNVNAEDFVRCDFIETNNNGSFSFKITLEDGVFYMNPNDVASDAGMDGKSKLLFHKYDTQAETLAKIFGLEEGLQITFVELLGAGGANITSIDINTKKAWHSRHALLLSQYTGECNTNIF